MVQVGDIVTYIDGQTKYYMKADEFQQLNDKRDIAKSSWTGHISKERIEPKNDANGRTYFDAWNNGNIGTGGGQHEFQSPGYTLNGVVYETAGTRKFVVEWYSSVEDFPQGNGCGADILLRAKLIFHLKHLKKTGNTSWDQVHEPFEYDVRVGYTEVKFQYGFHNPNNNCSYTDAVMGPSGPYAGYFGSLLKPGTGSPGSGWLSSLEWTVIQPADFYGEYHATHDLKKWEGYETGWVDVKNLPANDFYTFNFGQ
jgi:hypothetical protein